jgi:ketosteroid isomerase-like protein
MSNSNVFAIGASALVLSVLLSGCATAPTEPVQADYSQKQAQIKRRLKEIFDAAEKKDMVRLDSYHLYGPNFTKISAASVTRQDTTVARNGEHLGLGAITDLKMQASDLKIDVFGEVGIATFLLNSSFKAGADTIEKKEHSTLIFVNEHGAWKIAHEHFSAIKSNP